MLTAEACEHLHGIGEGWGGGTPMAMGLAAAKGGAKTRHGTCWAPLKKERGTRRQPGVLQTVYNGQVAKGLGSSYVLQTARVNSKMGNCISQCAVCSLPISEGYPEGPCFG